MKVLTFIVPAYNSGHFLEKCICSMLAPEILDRLEILIVNDGSTDDTAEIAAGFCSQYPEVVQLISQENKGHGGALNTACAVATGTYLKVIDADDWVETSNLPHFVRLLEQCSSDVVVTHYSTIDICTGDVRRWRTCPESFEQVYSFETIVRNWKNFSQNLTFHGITYRRQFYQMYATPLPEHIFYEDHEYATFPCCCAKSISCFDLFLYDYRIGDVNQSVSNENQLRRIGHMETVISRMLERYAALPHDDGQQYAALKIQGVLLSYFTTALLVNPNRCEGRRQAGTELKKCRIAAPAICAAVHPKFLVFYVMNLLHIGKSTWDKIIRSDIYNRVKRARL